MQVTSKINKGNMLHIGLPLCLETSVYVKIKSQTGLGENLNSPYHMGAQIMAPAACSFPVKMLVVSTTKLWFRLVERMFLSIGTSTVAENSDDVYLQGVDLALTQVKPSWLTLQFCGMFFLQSSGS